MPHRKTEDLLRDEYFSLLPEMLRLSKFLEIEIGYCLSKEMLSLKPHEKIVITSRIKGCESAIASLRRRQRGEGKIGEFDSVKDYSLKSLNDLVGVRVAVFPRNPLVSNINEILLKKFPEWCADPVKLNKKEGEKKILALKYYGHSSINNDITLEYQVVPLLTHLFWQAEHEAIYKPSIYLKGIENNPEMEQCVENVINALEDFENTFEKIESERLKNLN